MKVALVYLLKGKAEKYHQRLIRQSGPRFDENYMIENPIPSHITLKYPFETTNIKGLDKFLEKFAKINHKSKLELGGFGNFKKFVIFLKVRLFKDSVKIQKSLIKELKKLRIKPIKFDIKFKPHATVSYGNTKYSFAKIWNYVKKLDKPSFNLYLDNITILKKLKERWVIYKEFRLR